MHLSVTQNEKGARALRTEAVKPSERTGLRTSVEVRGPEAGLSPPVEQFCQAFCKL